MNRRDVTYMGALGLESALAVFGPEWAAIVGAIVFFLGGATDMTFRKIRDGRGLLKFLDDPPDEGQPS